MSKSTAQRGIGPRLQKSWSHAIEKEDTLRLNWFRKNEVRLNEIANQPPTRSVPEEVKNEVEQIIVDNFRNADRKPRIKAYDDELIDPGALQSIMKPVDPAVTKLIYTGANQEGRINYLHERVKLTPDQRFYFPECSSWVYGWNMWNTVKTIKKYGFGRQQVIKESFYRRRGVERDPDWYTEPAVFSPTVCTCSF
ncbi:unnamed protein product [Acanthoscelides obtectus]|uniref:Sperm microtubule inner protein 1 C-terminal domain-containing protein n=1 Tax=Acanthoscelides obtectus TaxID=200917 RepID=A0A9P0NY27_ACAOB|nr:unnamed protein product [Acanthoscelides obtectus]CAK1625307.1 hypothetical protein AOBTE_LOCUS3096 [Acanthoscelides obtectus]